MNIEERLSRVERQLTWHRRLASCLAAVVALLLLAGQGEPARELNADAVTARILRAEEIQLRSKDGRASIDMRFLKSGTPYVILRSERTKTQAGIGDDGIGFRNSRGFVVATYGSGGVHLSPPDTADGNDHRCVFLDADGAGELRLGTNTTFASLEAALDGTVDLTLRGPKARVVLGVTADGKTRIEREPAAALAEDGR